MDKNNFGYSSKEPCAVCGGYKNNQSEPRFGYTVCEDHQGVPPVEIDRNKLIERVVDLSEYEELYTKCMKCGHEVETIAQFNKEYREGKWFISEDDWVWKYEHDCSTKEIE